MSRFSERHGFTPSDAEITIRHDAPAELRDAVATIAYESGLRPHSLRSVIARILRCREDPSNWSAYPNVDHEARSNLDTCEWYEVYDIIEAIWTKLRNEQLEGSHTSERDHFTAELNKYFRRRGIGWQLRDGNVALRGPEVFEAAIDTARTTLAEAAFPTAAGEIHEALADLSRRPAPDTTGAIQHGLAALECAMRQIVGDPRPTMGAILARNPGLLPRPLDKALAHLWGFASEQGRHLREGRVPTPDDAQLVVHVAACIAAYLVKKRPS